jgi:serine protease Do
MFILLAIFCPEIETLVSETVAAGFHYAYPRATSAIVASHHIQAGFLGTINKPPLSYVIDKALNYGNSGGPIVDNRTGKVFAVCSAYQEVQIEQKRLKSMITIPTLYSYASSLYWIKNELTNLINNK